MFATSVLALTLTATPSVQPEVPAPDVRANVTKGLKWLAGQQRDDGTWVSNNNFYTVNTTAHAGLAFLMEGSTLKEGAYSGNIRKAVAWFEQIAQPDGLLVPINDPLEQGRQMQSHIAALLFLSSAHDTDDDPERRERLSVVVNAAVKYAVEGQSTRGGWGYVRAGDGNDFADSNTTTFALQALQVARKAGISVPRATFDKAAKYLTEATNAQGGLVYAVGPGFDVRMSAAEPFTTAAGAAVYVGGERHPAAFAKWVDYSLRNMPYQPRAGQPAQQEYTNSFTFQHHLALARIARAMGETGHVALDPERQPGERLVWSAHREGLFKYLVSTQEAAGNWTDPYVGPPHNTAVALIILQLDNNYLPAFGG